MNEEITTTAMEIPTHGDHVKKHTMYGMRYPDGNIVWDKELPNRERSMCRSTFKELALEPDRPGYKWKTHRQDWVNLMTERASIANLDLDEYMAEHQLVARKITMIIEEPVDFTEGAGA